MDSVKSGGSGMVQGWLEHRNVCVSGDGKGLAALIHLATAIALFPPIPCEQKSSLYAVTASGGERASASWVK